MEKEQLREELIKYDIWQRNLFINRKKTAIKVVDKYLSQQPESKDEYCFNALHTSYNAKTELCATCGKKCPEHTPMSLPEIQDKSMGAICKHSFLIRGNDLKSCEHCGLIKPIK